MSPLARDRELPGVDLRRLFACVVYRSICALMCGKPPWVGMPRLRVTAGPKGGNVESCVLNITTANPNTGRSLHWHFPMGRSVSWDPVLFVKRLIVAAPFPIIPRSLTPGSMTTLMYVYGIPHESAGINHEQNLKHNFTLAGFINICVRGINKCLSWQV